MAIASERGPYASGLARREAILDAALDLLGEVGYHGMSLRDVARRVGISHPGVIYHFPSKEVLLMSVVARSEKQMGFDLDQLERLDAVPILDAILDLIANLGRNPMISEVECMLHVEASSQIHPAHDHFVTRDERLLKLVAKAMNRLKQDGKLLETIDPDHAAQTSLALYIGLLTQWLYFSELDAPGQLARFNLNLFAPEFKEIMSQHYRESGWIV